MLCLPINRTSSSSWTAARTRSSKTSSFGLPGGPLSSTTEPRFSPPISSLSGSHSKYGGPTELKRAEADCVVGRSVPLFTAFMISVHRDMGKSTSSNNLCKWWDATSITGVIPSESCSAVIVERSETEKNPEFRSVVIANCGIFRDAIGRGNMFREYS